jgi:hypothetical protein
VKESFLKKKRVSSREKSPRKCQEARTQKWEEQVSHKFCTMGKRNTVLNNSYSSDNESLSVMGAF